jgi:peptide-methionine (R)-S-oxide reductase
MKKPSAIPILILFGLVALLFVYAGNGGRIVGRVEQLMAGTSARAKQDEGKVMKQKSMNQMGMKGEKVEKIHKTDAEWRKELTDEQYYVLREKGTEQAFTGKYYDSHAKGVYVCAACGNKLFGSDAKFESGTGWPSYFKPYSSQSVDTESDMALGMSRTEVTCARCGGHLGHVFNDGPPPTGLRYCINSAALKFIPADSLKSGEMMSGMKDDMSGTTEKSEKK